MNKFSVSFQGIVVAAVACSFVLTAASAMAASGTAVKTLSPKKATLTRTTSQPATVAAHHEAELYAKASGYVKELKVDIGERVRAGQVLAILDVPEMGKQREKLAAERDLLQRKREQIGAAVDVAEANLKALESENNRVQKLVKTGAVTLGIGDEAMNRFASAKAEFRVAQIEIRTAEAAVAVAQRAVEEVETLMKYATIKAPFAGVITERNIDPGDLVRNAEHASDPGAPLFIVTKTDKVRVRVPVPEREAIFVNVGDPAEFTSTALGGRTLVAKVSRIAGRLDPISRTMLIEIDLPNADGLLIPGMYGTVVITLEEKPNTVMIPSSSIRFNADGSESVVYVLKDGNKIAHVSVKLGYDNGNDIEVVSGLSGSERIVTGMLGRLSDGATVTVLNN